VGLLVANDSGGTWNWTERKSRFLRCDGIQISFVWRSHCFEVVTDNNAGSEGVARAVHAECYRTAGLLTTDSDSVVGQTAQSER